MVVDSWFIKSNIYGMEAANSPRLFEFKSWKSNVVHAIFKEIGLKFETNKIKTSYFCNFQ